jgi:succinate dehydrogenase / fumarate reductase membrane anchor subunit
MIETKSAPKIGEGTWLWLLKIFSGGLIIVLLLVHFIVNHLVAEGALLTYADVIAYYANPWIVLMEIIFLVVVISHGLIGLRSVILDLKLTPKIQMVIDIILVAVGLVSTGYGIWLALTVASLDV